MNTLTIRGIPKPVEQRLRKIARESHRSLNKAAIDLLQKAVGLGDNTMETSGKQRDVRGVFGKWTKKEAEEFERNTAIFESIDEEMWKR